FNDYDMFDVGEEMVNYKADVAIIHDPTGTDESGAWDQDYYRGSSRYEADALMHVGDTFAGAGATNSPRGASHLWAKGLILHYLMTGDERYYDVLEQVGEHLVYAFSTGGRAGTSCDSSPCYTVEVRHQGRAINNLVDLWKVTGDQTYLTVANNIFVNGILPYERNGSEGYTWFQMGNAPDYCGGDQCDAHMFYESVIIEPLINLYYALQEKDPVQATAVREYLARHAIWMRDKVYTNYQEADGGTYSGNQYFPYCTKIDWEDGYLWPPGQGYDDATYSFAFADNFAFMYRETGDINWLNLARAVFKDLLMYQCGTYQDINFSTDVTASGFQNSPYSAYLKEGKLRTKPMVYLYTEWEVFQSPGLVLKGTPADQSILLTWTVSGTLPATSTWQIDYQSQTGTLYTPVTGIISPTRAYTLTGLTNYVWYTVTLNGMLGSASFLADTVRVMPTDISVYLPLLLRGQ
ncbi:MAG: hypothetical protein SXV54_04415, partial [Chloroflexota bacterium]|nr:hypothetical protein [Chloroflexota bacterium]